MNPDYIALTQKETEELIRNNPPEKIEWIEKWKSFWKNRVGEDLILYRSESSLQLKKDPNEWLHEIKINTYYEMHWRVYRESAFFVTDSFEDYNEGRTHPHRTSQSEEALNSLIALDEKYPKTKTLLDLGAGQGGVVRLANQLNFEAYGIEKSKAVLEETRHQSKGYGIDHSKIFYGNFMTEELWKNTLGEISANSFDAYYLYQPPDIRDKALEFIVDKISPSATVIIPSVEYPTHDREDIRKRWHFFPDKIPKDHRTLTLLRLRE